jgi:uncharacterized protein (DUF885 family)
MLDRYCSDYWEYVLKHNPTFATYIGDHRYNDALEDLSEAAIRAENDYFKELLARVEEVDTSSLTAEEKINHHLLQKTLQNHIRFYEFGTHHIPLNHLQGPHIDFPQIIEFHPFKTIRDYEHFYARLTAFSRQIDQVIELLQTGIKKNIRAFRKSIEHVVAQVEMFARHTPEESPLYQSISRAGDGFSDSEKDEISTRVRDAISVSVIPAYQRLHEYLKTDYMSQSREQEGIWSLPDGTDLYRLYVQYHTTTDLSPEEIHEIGLREVRMIEDKIQEIMGRIGFNGSIRGFSAHLKEKKDLYPKTGQEILAAYREILSHMDERIPEYFGRLPKAGYAVKEIEHYREKTAPAAYYYPPPRDFSRPGYFYANTYKPEERAKYEMEALSYHEAVPGHHLQVAIMQELEHIPDFRRYGGSTAFIEGWALYAETLSKEMGFYKDHYAEYGRLSFGLWRAVRLVVDTGLHFFQWSREKAIQYCQENTGLEDHEIEVEVDRYIAIPGQALSYKIGELKILELREKSQNVFGSLFDIRKFHDRLLEHGALPLDVLEEMVLSWIESKAS